MLNRVSTGQRWALGLAVISLLLWIVPGWLANQVHESGCNTMEEMVDRALGMLVLTVQPS